MVLLDLQDCTNLNFTALLQLSLKGLISRKLTLVDITRLSYDFVAATLENFLLHMHVMLQFLQASEHHKVKSPQLSMLIKDLQGPPRAASWTTPLKEVNL